MNTEEIQKKLNDLIQPMLIKGLVKPSAEYELVSDTEPSLWLKYRKFNESNDWEREYHKFTGQSMFEDAVLFIEGLPTSEERKTSEFMAALAGVIELGKENGIDVQFVNPLTEAMKRLSENIITHQK